MDDGTGIAAADRRHHLSKVLIQARHPARQHAGTHNIRPATLPSRGTWFWRRFALTLRRCLPTLLCCGALSSQCLAAVELPQADGSTLLLEQPATTLITLSPHLAELVYAAGLGERLLATVEYSEYPEAARSLPRIGDAFRLDLERIITLAPDLVVAWHSGNPAAGIERLRSLGLNVWSVEITRPQQIADTLQQLGLATGQTEPAASAARQVEQQFEALRQRYTGLEPVSYFYQVAGKPLFTINGQHLISAGFELCGGVNVFADQPALAPQISRESVIVANPQAMLAPVLPGQENPLTHWLQWHDLQAVQNDALFLLNADKISRATPRILEALQTGCKLLDGIRTTTQ